MLTDNRIDRGRDVYSRGEGHLLRLVEVTGEAVSIDDCDIQRGNDYFVPHFDVSPMVRSGGR